MSSPSPAASDRDLLRRVAAGIAGKVGEEFFHSLVRHLAEAFAAEAAFVAELFSDPAGRARILAAWENGVSIPEGTEYDVAGTVCERVMQDELVTFPDGVRARYPDDRLIALYGLDGYLAIVLWGADGARIGYLGVQASRRLDPGEDEIAALRIFAARAGAEVQRRRHEAMLAEREAEIAASRARLVQAADQERRRIGRDLHDGVQQRLVALGHCLDLARRRFHEAPDEAMAFLDRARSESRVAGHELRELARGLHPVGLSDHGLEVGLTSLAARSALPLRVLELPERRLPDAIETAIYFMVSEAVSNAVKYARASEVRIRASRRARQVLVDISDDGAGGADETRGTGLRGLADRVEALGGMLEIVSPPGRGTRLLATIPLVPWRSSQDPVLEFGYEGDDGLGEHLIELIRTGRKTAGVSLAREWDLEGGPPRIGQRLPVTDHLGRRRATVEVQRVVVAPFGDVGEEVVRAEGSGLESVEAWREAQRRFYEQSRGDTAVMLEHPGWRLSDQEPMVITWFRLLDEPEGAPDSGPDA